MHPSDNGWAQPAVKSNLDILGDLAVGCLGDVPNDLDSFILESGERMRYLQPRLTEYWRSEGKQVFLADSAAGLVPPESLHRLNQNPEEGFVSYLAGDGDKLTRMVSFSVAFQLLAPTGLLVDEGRCSDRYSDSIGRNEILLVERDPFPETRGQVPPEGSWRDWAEPVALGAAIGVVAYLFFTVRSS